MVMTFLWAVCMMQWMDPQVLTAFAVTCAAGLATLIGGAWVLCFKTPNMRVLSFGLAFAAGAMVYVSLTELLNKSIHAFSFQGNEAQSFAYATGAFLLGLILVLILDRFIPNPHENIESEHVFEGQKKLLKTGILTFFAITAHNLPEGLASFFATLDSPSLGAPLAFAIAIHNIPEGVAIALPVYMATGRKDYAIWASLIAGLAEPFGAFIGYWILAPYMGQQLYGVIFGLIAGVMVYLALDELLPTAKRYAKGHETVYGLVSGMTALASSLVVFKFIQ